MQPDFSASAIDTRFRKRGCARSVHVFGYSSGLSFRVFTTKTFGLVDMAQQLGVRRASFLPHSFDSEVHFPISLDDRDLEKYACDVSFIGTWSPKKQRILESLATRLPTLRLKIWGSQWEKRRGLLGTRVQGREVIGREFAKAMRASKINLCILSEIQPNSSSGDQITSRTFHIPATGAFMLHERSAEIGEYFREGTECACFASIDELVDVVQQYLQHDAERQAIAAAGLQRCRVSDYSVDARAVVVMQKVEELLNPARHNAAA